jgi:hypothetical protein
MNGLKICTLVLLFAALSPGVSCQVASTTAKQQSANTFACEPTSSQAEVRVFQAAQPKIRAHFSATFSDSDIQQIECDGWRDYRKLHPGEQLDADKFLKFASENFGGLKVTSNPDGAAIRVDDKPWSDATNTQSSCKVGIRHVKLTKPGYQDELGDAIVKEGQWTLFHRDLKKK